MDNSKSNKIKVNCSWCNKVLERQPHRIKSTKHHFCNSQCKAKWQKSDKNDYRDKISNTVKKLCSDGKSWAKYNNKKKENARLIIYCKNCGKEIITKKGNKKGKVYCSKECCTESRKRWIGSKNGNWKNGKTKLQFIIRSSEENKEWIKNILKRDKYQCKVSKLKKNLHVHHIIPLSKIIDIYKINKNNWRKYTKILFNINNGITLTKKEHNNTRNNELEYANYYRSLV